MKLNLESVESVIGIYGRHKNTLPKRMRFLHPEAAQSFREHLADVVIVSDMFRSAKESLEAMKRKSGVQPPGYSAHNYGLAIDIDVTRTLEFWDPKARKQHLDQWMEKHGWYCHRKDHKRGKEWWHYNYLGRDGGGYLRDTDRYNSSAIERKIQDLYGDHFEMTKYQVEALLGITSIRIAIKAFQRKWGLLIDGIAGPRTKRTLAYVSAE